MVEVHPADDSLQQRRARSDLDECSLGMCEWYPKVLGGGDHGRGHGSGVRGLLRDVDMVDEQ